jgi:hypothetical protein
VPASLANWLSCHVHIDSLLEVGPRLSWALDREGAGYRRLRASRDRYPDC